MKRALVLPFLVFLAWGALPSAGANSVPHIDLTCDAVTVEWIDFPARPVDLTVTLTQHGREFVTSVSTEGQRDGETVIPANFSDGPASAEVAWTLAKEHHAGPVETVLHCSETTSTTATTEPSTTPPDECGPDTLACTGSSSSAPLLFGFGLVALGAVFMALNRRGTR